MDTSRLAVIILGILCLVLVGAITAHSLAHIEPPIALSSSLAAALGALLALIHPPRSQ